MNSELAEDQIQQYLEKKVSDLDYKLRCGLISLEQYDATLRRILNTACKLYDGVY
jgi:hypothetical protein